ncbi:MAG TPA: DnaJ C-terminal domain-containing protein [Geobacteraceae bacterium]|nr:DnaJ C-terminal domain-containing protein [Geobacteraceae bacterium]
MSVTFQDYYKILGLERSATQDEIQRAYRKLARTYHPDISKEPDAEEKFKQINEAYEVLKDPESRRKYDSIGTGFQGGEEFSVPPGWENVRFYHSGGEGADYSDFFRAIFGDIGGFASGEMPGGGQRRRRGRDYETNLEITLEDACNGVKRVIDLETVASDEEGRPVKSRQSFDVKIPKGVTEGSRIKLRGQGGKGVGGAENGDLYLKIHLQKDPRFQVEHHNLLGSVAIAPWEAALGTKVAVPTIGGSVNMTIPAGTQSGQVFKLRGKGIPRRTGEAGDLMITARIVVPAHLTEREKQLFEELARESSFRPRG